MSNHLDAQTEGWEPHLRQFVRNIGCDYVDIHVSYDKEEYEALYRGALAASPTVTVQCPRSECEDGVVLIVTECEAGSNYYAPCPDCRGSGTRRAILLPEDGR